jgi:hypothetical protein
VKVFGGTQALGSQEPEDSPALPTNFLPGMGP